MMLDRVGGAMARLLDVPCENPDFPLTHAGARAEMARMAHQPARPPLARPVVVLAGWRAWPMMARSLAGALRRLCGAPADQFAAVAFPWCTDFAVMTRRVVDLVQARWPSEDPAWTREVDVVGVSMGGLVARAAAAGLGVERRLRISRLFTLGTPHRGAVLAARIAPDAPARDMRPGSALLAELDRVRAEGGDGAGYEIHAFARLRDSWIGPGHSAPPGQEAVWVSGTRLLSHITIASDPRLVVEIARRLRGEAPLGQTSSARRDGGHAPPRSR
jgi:pimeloyl-ACP methyl ester carboxylesterase